MPAQQPFTVHIDPDHIDPDDLARPVLADAVPLPSALDGAPSTGSAQRRHGSGDDRMDARRRSGRERSARASGAGKGRSYAFRRS